MPGDHWGNVKGKLQRCRKSLQIWVQKTKRKTETLIRRRTCDLAELQTSIVGASLEAKKAIKDEMHVLLEEEDLKWKQHAKESWLKNGITIPSIFTHVQNRGVAGV